MPPGSRQRITSIHTWGSVGRHSTEIASSTLVLPQLFPPTSTFHPAQSGQFEVAKATKAVDFDRFKRVAGQHADVTWVGG